MGKMQNGMFGPFTGKIGRLVGVYRNGVHYVKSAPERTKPFTEPELINQNRFKVAELWLKPILGFVKIGFNVTGKHAKNAAKSYLLRNAMEGKGMNIRVNPELMLVSKGLLDNSSNLHVSVDVDFNLRFEWDVSYVTYGNARDQVMMMAYDIECKRAYVVTTGNFRCTGMDVLFIPPEARSKTLHIYAAFCGYDRLDQSNSVYLGVVNI